MKSKLAWQQAGERIWILVLDDGEEAFKAISAFAQQQHIAAASITALGAFSGAVVGWFDFGRKEYRRIPVAEQCEVLSVLGDIAEGDDGKPSLHLHAVLGLEDGSTRGGHLLEGTVHPTLEITLTETPAHLRRRRRAELGIALIDAE
jgi:hypothetical protein